MVNGDLLLVIRSSALGDGEPDLGEKLIHSFLAQLLEGGDIPARIICQNSGIFLTTTPDTPILKLLGHFAEAGTDIQSCGTCLEYYGRQDQLLIGSSGNMKDTVRAMLDYQKVLQI